MRPHVTSHFHSSERHLFPNNENERERASRLSLSERNQKIIFSGLKLVRSREKESAGLWMILPSSELIFLVPLGKFLFLWPDIACLCIDIFFAIVACWVVLLVSCKYIWERFLLSSSCWIYSSIFVLSAVYYLYVQRTGRSERHHLQLHLQLQLQLQLHYCTSHTTRTSYLV